MIHLGRCVNSSRMVHLHTSRDYLNNEFPPRSPDLTPLDFYLWGVLKDTVYAMKPETLHELVLVISWLRERFGINFPSYFTKLRNLPSEAREI